MIIKYNFLIQTLTLERMPALNKMVFWLIEISHTFQMWNICQLCLGLLDDKSSA